MKKSIHTLTLASVMFTPALAFADASAGIGQTSNAKGLGFVMERLKEVGTQAVDLVFVVAMLIGVFIILSGIFTLKKAADSNGQQVTYGNALTKIAIGACLMVPEMFIALTTDTAYGDYDTGVQSEMKNRFDSFGNN